MVPARQVGPGSAGPVLLSVGRPCGNRYCLSQVVQVAVVVVLKVTVQRNAN